MMLVVSSVLMMLVVASVLMMLVVASVLMMLVVASVLMMLVVTSVLMMLVVTWVLMGPGSPHHHHLPQQWCAPLCTGCLSTSTSPPFSATQQSLLPGGGGARQSTGMPGLCCLSHSSHQTSETISLTCPTQLMLSSAPVPAPAPPAPPVAVWKSTQLWHRHHTSHPSTGTSPSGLRL
jgi:hypothetical protein